MKTEIRRKIRTVEGEERRAEKRKRKKRLTSIMSADFWPLNAPGMPVPGADFMEAAIAQDDGTTLKKGKGITEFTPGSVLIDMYRRALREVGYSMSVTGRGGQKEVVEFLPGHLWGQNRDELEDSVGSGNDAPPVDGPHRADVMVIGKMPWRDEMIAQRNLYGPSGQILLSLCRKLHIKGLPRWYITNLVKFMPPGETTQLKANWIHDCKPLLHQELRIVRPKYILCLGADASTALLGKQYTVGYMAGRVIPYEYPIHLSHDHEPEFHTAQVMTVLHPVEVSRSPEKERILNSNLGRFAHLLKGADFSLEEKDIDHRSCNTLEDAEEWVREVELEMRDTPAKLRFIGLDAEWEGQHPQNEGSYVRTVQLSWGPKKAICFIISHPGGKVAFRDRDGKPAVKRLVKLLNGLMVGKRCVTHFGVSDLEWVHWLGFYPTKHCPVPLDGKTIRKGKHKGRFKAAWERLRDGEGWLDTGMMSHAIEETAPMGLEMLSMRYTTAPRYDIPLEDWKKDFCKKRKITATALEGYGECPDHILVPYACYDADVTLRAALNLMALLDSDYEGNCCWEPFWESMIIQPVILSIHNNGVLVDRKRIDELTAAFLTGRSAQEEAIREWAHWDDFNIRSTQHVREFLFGYKLNGRRDKRGKPVRIRPEGALSLRVKPLLDTSKPPRRWEDLVARNQDKFATPGTGKLILSILAQDNLEAADQINTLRDYRFLDQALKSVLRPPKTDDDGAWMRDDDGFLDYDAGLASCIDDDKRVRTHLYPTAETGRWKSARPNLQNISKSRDPDYERLLGAEYKHKLRSILMATPGYALVEFDYKGAELFGMALMAGDKNMIEHTQRANHPDEGYDAKGNLCPGGKSPHPQYYDIHSNVAVMAFQLKVTDHVNPKLGKPANVILGLPIGAPCPANKFALTAIGKVHFRVLAKNVIFGIAYGRGAKAIALQARENKVNVTPDEAQLVIDAIFGIYPELVPFFEEAKSRARDERWLCHCFGRFRRFPSVSDFKLAGEFERQAMNFPIQGMIASVVNRGLARLHKAILDYELEDSVKLLLQIHDAGLLEVRYDMVQYVAEELIPYAASECVPIYPTNLAGVPTGDGPYYLGIDVAVENHWGEKYSKEECLKLGIPLKFAA